MITWAAYDRRTGDVIEELPGLRITSSVSQVIGRGEQVTCTLPVSDRLPDRWRDATQQGRSLIAGHIPGGEGEGPAGASVLWGGWVSRRTYGSGPEISLTLQPVEEWLARTYIPAAAYASTPYTTIARAIGLDALAEHFNGRVVEVTSSDRGDRTYTDDQDMTRLAGLQNLMRAQRGCEWSTSWELDTQGRLGLVVHVASMLGARATDEQGPTVLLSDVDWSITDDYGAGRGATVFTGTTTRAGDERLTVTRRATHLISQGWLELERRWQPDTGSVSIPVITGYVEEAMAAQQLGTSTISVRAQLDRCVPGRDFRLGDDIAIDLQAPDLHEAGASITARLLGWAAEPDPVSGEIYQITPILTDEES